MLSKCLLACKILSLYSLRLRRILSPHLNSPATTAISSSSPESFFHDRPIITQNNRLYFISAHEQPDRHFKNWTVLYAVKLDGEDREITRVTHSDTADFSPKVSKSGEFLAVTSYGSRSWGGEFHEINTEIAVFRASEPEKRMVVCERGGWPNWSGDSTVFFHHQADDGWWSIFQVDLPENFKDPIGISPPGLHCFTPAAFHDGKRIAIATRRRGVNHRHIEVFDLENKTFDPVTESLNHMFSPNRFGIKPLNPFSPKSIFCFF